MYKSKSDERRIAAQTEGDDKKKTADVEADAPAAAENTDEGESAAAAAKPRDPDAPYKDAAEAKEDMKSEHTFGERRSDGEIEGVTVNTDKYQGAKFENLHAQYKEAQDAAAKADQGSEKEEA